jgi:hypothetical protein
MASTLAWQARTAAGRRPVDEPLWLEWITLIGLFAFATWLLGVKGVWGLLLRADPTGITLVIIIVFTASTLWCGRRARELSRQRRLLEEALAARATSSSTAPRNAEGWAADYWRGLAAQPADIGAPLDLLLERTHGSHGTAWWVNGIQLKLGLLGKVIGFSILALEIGGIQNFDPAQSQELLKSLTLGLGVALLTTMVGLVGNILLGLQLTRLDRFADSIVERAQRHAVELAASNAKDDDHVVPLRSTLAEARSAEA